MRGLGSDLKHALRGFRRAPLFSVAAILTLAFGIGATTALYSVAKAVLFEPLPYRDPDRLVVVWNRHSHGEIANGPASGPDFVDYRADTTAFDGFAGLFSLATTLTGVGDPEQVRAAWVNAELFDVIGVELALGRTFRPDEEGRHDPSLITDPTVEPESAPIIISHGLWQRRFGGDPEVLGTTVQVTGQPMFVVGVAPASFRLYLPGDASRQGLADIFTPFPVALQEAPRDGQFLAVIGRLAHGATLAAAQGEMNVIAERLRAEHDFHRRAGTRIDLEPLHRALVGEVRPTLLTLLIAAGCVLLIACANVANLFLARAAGRRKEMALRSVLGAGALRLARMVIVETVLLALAGGLAGIALAALGVRWLRTIGPDNLPRVEQVGIDPGVLLFACAVSLLVGLTLGLVPAARTLTADLAKALRGQGRTAGRDGRPKLRGALVIAEVALSLALLIGAGLMVRTFGAVRRVEPGFEAEQVLTVSLSLPFFRYRMPDDRADFLQRLQARLRTLPGVELVGGSARLPLSGDAQIWRQPFALEGDSEEDWSRREADYRAVLPGYFRSMGIRLLGGRDFTAFDDRAEAAPVAVIDTRLAERAFPGESPLGKRVKIVKPNQETNSLDRVWVEIVGVVGHVRGHTLMADGPGTIYAPQRMWAWVDMGYTLKTAVEPLSLGPAVRAAVHELDSELPIVSLRPMTGYLDDARATTRFLLILILCFAAVAAVLAAIGIYGVIAYEVRQQTREIGIRVACGARPFDVFRWVVGRGMRLTGIGLALGLAGAWALGRGLSSVLYGVTATDPATYLGILLLLTAIAFLACALPAREGLRLDPARAIRQE